MLLDVVGSALAAPPASAAALEAFKVEIDGLASHPTVGAWWAERDAAWLEMDHNLNASLNLKMLAGSSPVSACCPGSSGHARKSVTKLLVGQEPSREDEVYD